MLFFKFEKEVRGMSARYVKEKLSEPKTIDAENEKMVTPFKKMTPPPKKRVAFRPITNETGSKRMLMHSKNKNIKNFFIHT